MSDIRPDRCRVLEYATEPCCRVTQAPGCRRQIHPPAEHRIHSMSMTFHFGVTVSTALLRRRGAARVFGVLASCALAGTGIVVSTTAASAEEESVTESLQTFAAEAFAPQADELPSGLIEAIERDLGISPAESLANAAAAKVAAD